jgi:hypothetical protein
MHCRIEMGNKIAILFIFLIFLSACASIPNSVPINTFTPSTTPLTPPVASTTTSVPTPTSIPLSTPLAGTPRWVLYERALAYIFLGPPGKTVPHLGWDHGLCEWEIWGQKENEVYVWAVCQANNAIGTATSGPAVIRLGKEDEILEVEMPQEGWGNLKELFPDNILSKIQKNEFPGDEAWARLQKRRKESSIPPLIVEQGVELP